MKSSLILIVLVLATTFRLSAQATTATALASSVNPSSANQSVIFTATVTSQFGGPVTGSVIFNQGTTALSTVPLTNGQANYTTPFNAGAFSITATYSGDSNNQASTSATLSQTVNQAATSTVLVSSPDPSFINQSVTFAATVTSQYGEVVTGNVTLKNGTTVIATVPVTSGQASYTKIYLAAGTRSITATYSGDSNNLGSTSSAVSQVVGPTTTVVSSSLNPATLGQSVMFTAQVTSSFGPIPNGELVTFFNGTAKMASVALSGGVATYSTSSLSVGSHGIVATYPGNSTFAKSTSNVAVQMVNKAATSTTLASSENPSNEWQSVTLTATVAAQNGGTATGTVSFYNGNTRLGSVTLSGGVAHFTTSTLAVGSDSITAIYNGSNLFFGSKTGLTQTVSAGTSVQGSMIWDGTTRYYSIFVPTVLPANPAMVIMLHGTQTTSTFDPTTITSLPWGWIPVANNHQFIVVQPASTWDPKTGQWNWNAYFMDAAFPYAQGCGAQDCPDDSGFLRQLIINLTAQYDINPQMVFVTGMSSGAQMTERVGVEISDLVAAISPVSGQLGAQQSVPPPVLVPGNVVAPISVQEWHGTLDTVLSPCNYGTTPNSGVTFTMDTVDDTFNYWVQQNNCTALQTSQPLCLNGQPNYASDASTPGVTGSTGNIGTSCVASNVEVQFIWEPNLGHSWESQNNGARWQFFAAHPKGNDSEQMDHSEAK